MSHLRCFYRPPLLLLFVFILEAFFARSLFFVRAGYGAVTHLGVTFLFLAAICVLWGPRTHFVRVRKAWRSVQWVAIVYVLWAIVSGLSQTQYFWANAAFTFLWSLNLIALTWVVPAAVEKYDANEMQDIIAVLVEFLVYSSLLCLPVTPFVNGRFTGVFWNATTSGHLFAYGTVFSFCMILSFGIKRRWAMLFIASACSLILSRTRVSIFGTVFAMSVVPVVLGWKARQFARLKWRLVIAGFCISFCIFMLIASMIVCQSLKTNVIQHLRLSKGLADEVESARLQNWQAGAKEFLSATLCGKGFISKYGGTQEARVLWITYPLYDWLGDADPLNSLFAMTKQLGYIGGLLDILFMLCLARSVLHMSDIPTRGLLIGLLALGMAWAVFDESWLWTIGDPIDRLSLVSFSTLLSYGRDWRSVKRFAIH